MPQPQQMFAALGKFFKIQSDALLKFAGSDAADEVDAEAMSALLGGLQASASALGFSASGKPLTSDQLVRAEKKRKRLDKKAAKDPNAPKRPASAYLLYQNECRDAVKSSMPEGTAYAETLKKIGEMWKELTPEAKQVSRHTNSNQHAWTDERPRTALLTRLPFCPIFLSRSTPTRPTTRWASSRSSTRPTPRRRETSPSSVRRQSPYFKQTPLSFSLADHRTASLSPCSFAEGHQGRHYRRSRWI